MPVPNGKTPLTFKDRLASLGFASYADYLASDHWIAFRRLYRQSEHPQRCAVCKTDLVQLHHINKKPGVRKSLWQRKKTSCGRRIGSPDFDCPSSQAMTRVSPDW